MYKKKQIFLACTWLTNGSQFSFSWFIKLTENSHVKWKFTLNSLYAMASTAIQKYDSQVDILIMTRIDIILGYNITLQIGYDENKRSTFLLQILCIKTIILLCLCIW